MTNFEATLREAIARASEEGKKFLICNPDGTGWQMRRAGDPIWEETRGHPTFTVTGDGLSPHEIMEEMFLFNIDGEQDWELERTTFMLENNRIDVYPTEVIVNGEVL
jgi:hypothetical protein